MAAAVRMLELNPVPDRTNLALLTLPEEVLDHILSSLVFHDLITARNTCLLLRRLVSNTLLEDARSLAKPDFLAQETSMFEDMKQEVEKLRLHAFTDYTALNELRFARSRLENPAQLICYTCLILLRIDRFGVSQKRKKRSFGHDTQAKRICALCASKAEQKPMQQPICMSDNMLLVYCWQCETLRKQMPDLPEDRAGCDKPCTSVLDEWKGKTASDREPALSERFNRCQKCWAKDHSTRPVDVIENGQHLCFGCWEQHLRVNISKV